MATYAEQNTLASDTAFQARVKVAAMLRIVQLLPTNLTSPQLALGRDFMQNPDAYTARLAFAVMSDATVAASAPSGTGLTDAQLQTATNTVLPLFVR